MGVTGMGVSSGGSGATPGGADRDGTGEQDRLWVSAGSPAERRTARRARAAAVCAGVVVLLAGTGVAVWFTLSSSVEVLADGEQLVTRTVVGDVAGVLSQLDIEVGAADEVEPAPDTPVADGLRVAVTRATPVEVHVDGQAHQVDTTADTVAAALRLVGVELGERDLVDPEVDQALNGATVITVHRVEYVTEVIETTIDHGENHQETADLPLGESAVETEGEPGLRRQTYEVTVVDGQETDRELLIDEVAREPVDRVVLDGTGPTPLEEAQGILASLGYPVGPVDGIEGGQTRRALCAWRRLEGHEVGRQGLQPGELEALRATSGLPAAAAGRGATADRTCQAVYYRQDGRWQHVHRASTGADGLPRPGEYRIQRARAGWHTSTLYPADNPNMYNTLYIRGAIAIHGSHSVPPHPASKGCVRVTPAAADQLFSALSVGDPVTVIGTY